MGNVRITAAGYAWIEVVDQQRSGAGDPQGLFVLPVPGDTYLDMRQWERACVDHGINLGRYWSVGPQQTLYVPAEC